MNGVVEERGERKEGGGLRKPRDDPHLYQFPYMRCPAQASEVLSNSFFFLCVQLQPQLSVTGSGSEELLKKQAFLFFFITSTVSTMERRSTIPILC